MRLPVVPARDRSRRPVLGGGVLAALAMLGLTVAVATRLRALTRFDGAVSAAARRVASAHPWWRAAMSAVTHTADTDVLLSLALAAIVVLLWLRRWTMALFLVAAVVAGTAVRLVVLHLVARPRPLDRLTPAAGWAFPSGHTTSAGLTAGIAVVLCLAVLRPGCLRRTLIGVVVGWAALVGVSRVALLAHWPTDVLGGWLLATAVVALLSLTRLRPTAARR